jgi:hypothetical protein
MYILHQSKKLMKSIGILSHLVETGIGGKGKGLLLVETYYAQVNSSSFFLFTCSVLILPRAFSH